MAEGYSCIKDLCIDSVNLNNLSEFFDSENFLSDLLVFFLHDHRKYTTSEKKKHFHIDCFSIVKLFSLYYNRKDRSLTKSTLKFYLFGFFSKWIGIDGTDPKLKASDIWKVGGLQVTYVYFIVVFLSYDVFEELFAKDLDMLSYAIRTDHRIHDGPLPTWFTNDFNYQAFSTWKSIADNLMTLIAAKLDNYSYFKTKNEFSRLIVFDQSLPITKAKVRVLRNFTLSYQQTLFRNCLGKVLYGIYMMKEDNYEGAIEFFDNAIQNIPECSAFHYWKYFCNRFFGKYEDAIKVILKHYDNLYGLEELRKSQARGVLRKNLISNKRRREKYLAMKNVQTIKEPFLKYNLSLEDRVLSSWVPSVCRKTFRAIEGFLHVHFKNYEAARQSLKRIIWHNHYKYNPKCEICEMDRPRLLVFDRNIPVYPPQDLVLANCLIVACLAPCTSDSCCLLQRALDSPVNFDFERIVTENPSETEIVANICYLLVFYIRLQHMIRKDVRNASRAVNMTVNSLMWKMDFVNEDKYTTRIRLFYAFASVFFYSVTYEMSNVLGFHREKKYIYRTISSRFLDNAVHLVTATLPFEDSNHEWVNICFSDTRPLKNFKSQCEPTKLSTENERTVRKMMEKLKKNKDALLASSNPVDDMKKASAFEIIIQQVQSTGQCDIREQIEEFEGIYLALRASSGPLNAKKLINLENSIAVLNALQKSLRGEIDAPPVAGDAQVGTDGHNVLDESIEEQVRMDAQLEDVRLVDAQLEDVGLVDAQLEDVGLVDAQLEDVGLVDAQLEDVRLVDAQLEDVRLVDAQLEDVGLVDAQLEDVGLVEEVRARRGGEEENRQFFISHEDKVKYLMYLKKFYWPYLGTITAIRGMDELHCLSVQNVMHYCLLQIEEFFKIETEILTI